MRAQGVARWSPAFLPTVVFMAVKAGPRGVGAALSASRQGEIRAAAAPPYAPWAGPHDGAFPICAPLALP